MGKRGCWDFCLLVRLALGGHRVPEPRVRVRRLPSGGGQSLCEVTRRAAVAAMLATSPAHLLSPPPRGGRRRAARAVGTVRVGRLRAVGWRRKTAHRHLDTAEQLLLLCDQPRVRRLHGAQLPRESTETLLGVGGRRAECRAECRADAHVERDGRAVRRSRLACGAGAARRPRLACRVGSGGARSRLRGHGRSRRWCARRTLGRRALERSVCGQRRR